MVLGGEAKIETTNTHLNNIKKTFYCEPNNILPHKVYAFIGRDLKLNNFEDKKNDSKRIDRK